MSSSIVLSNTFLESLDKLSKQSKKMVRSSLSQLADTQNGNGFQVHSLNRVKCDKSFRSARVNDDLRLILSHVGEKYILLYVDHHDDAYDWANDKFMKINDFGALYVYDSNIDLEFIQGTHAIFADGYLPTPNVPTLLQKQEISSKNLKKLGVNEIHAENLMRITDEDIFVDYIAVFPQELQEGLFDLMLGTKTITEIFAELDDINNPKAKTIEEALRHKDSKRRFYTVTDLKELEAILEDDFTNWRLFLHPKQAKLVKQNFQGPVLVEGGPGTGKTVVGIHRAVHLAQSIYTSQNAGKILFCTYNKKLAKYIEERLIKLLSQKGVERNIEVEGIDKLIRAYVFRYNLAPNMRIDPKEIKTLFNSVYAHLNPTEPIHFYQAEYVEIVQKYNLKTLEDYLKVDRSGLGKGLNPGARKYHWNFFEIFLLEKRKLDLIDFEDLGFLLLDALENKQLQPVYDSIILDEAQDLSPVKIKVLAMLVKQQANNFMILSDQNQRIFRMNSWRRDVKINIVGRTHHLNLNYRTTKQIREYADHQFTGTNQVLDHIREYKSLLMGPDPLIKDYDTAKQQYSYIVQKVKDALERGIQPHEICIVTPFDVERIANILEYEDIPTTKLIEEIYPKEGLGVCVSTLFGCKGLEFRLVIIANYTEIGKEILWEKEEEWYVQQRIKQLECAKYVAATRAREELIITFINKED